MSSNTAAVEKYVSDLLSHDKSGHGMDHIRRVLRLSVDFLRHLFEEEGAEDWLEYLREYQ